MTRLATSTALALCLGASPALADLTTQQVWDRLETTMTDMGYTVTATETASGNALEITDMTLVYALPDDEGTVTAEIARLSFAENGDGSVLVEMSDSVPITIVASLPDEEPERTVMTYNDGDLTVTISGTPSDLQYDYTGSAVSISLVEMLVDGEPMMTDDSRFDVTLSDVSGSATIKNAPGQPSDVTQESRIASLAYDLAFPDELTGDMAQITGALEDVTLDSQSSLPEGFNPNDPEAMAIEGFESRVNMAYASGAMTFAVPGEAGINTGTSQSASGAFELVAEDGSFTYDMSAEDLSYAMTSAELPVPVNVDMSAFGLRLTFPTMASDTPEDVGVALTLSDLALSDAIWSLFDSAGVLPRDPATLVLNLTGQVTPNMSLMQPEAMVAGGVPGELNALTLENFEIDAAGAKLTGTGDFRFDNDDLQTFGGVPRPEGSATFSVSGANALIDKLISMGVLTSEDAMGARMMMGMFAVPGDAPDSLNSTITINEQGHVLANGMRIQ